MGVNVGAGIAAGLQLAAALVADIEAAVAKGGGVAAEGVDMVELAIADSAVRASMAALIAAL